MSSACFNPIRSEGGRGSIVETQRPYKKLGIEFFFIICSALDLMYTLTIQLSNIRLSNTMCTVFISILSGPVDKRPKT